MLVLLRQDVSCRAGVDVKMTFPLNITVYL